MLARLIPPAEFGVTVVAMFVAAIAQSVAIQGIGSFLVHIRTPSREHYQAAVLLCLVAGLVGSALTAGFALTAAPSIFGERAADLLLIAAPVTLLSSLTAVPLAELQRRLDFPRLAVVEAGMSLASPLIAVLLAVAGVDGEALIVGMLASAAVAALLASVYSPPTRPGWFPSEMREIAAYGAPASGSSILYATLRNIDYVILAARLPAAQVGYYLRAFQLGSDYQAKISGILLRVAFPVLSRSRDLQEIRRVRARIVRVHAAVLFPLLFGLIALAPTFVPFVYGEAWAPAAPLTQVLAIGGMVAVLGTGTGPLLLATGHPHALLAYTSIVVGAYVAGVLIAVPYGLLAVSWTVVGVMLVSFVVLQYAVVERAVGIPLLETLSDAGPAVVAGLGLLATAWLGVHWLDAMLPTLLVLVLPGIAGLGVYMLILRLLFAATWRDLSLLIGSLTLRTPALDRLGARSRTPDEQAP